MDDLWEMITADTSVTDYSFSSFYKVFEQDSNGSFCQDSDEMKPNRDKVNHR